MHILKRSLLLVGVAGFALTACKDDDPVATPQPKVNSVTVTPNLTSVRIGQTVTLVATLDVENDAATTVTWSSSDQSKATVGQTTGVVTGVGVGPVVITATSTADPTKKGAATVNVVAGQVLSVEVLPGEVTLFGGQTAQFAAVVNTEAGVPNTVTWRISPSDNSVASINATTGVVTAAANSTTGVRTAVVTAVSTADTTKRGAATVRVNPGQPPSGVISVQVNPASATMRFGDPNQVYVAQVQANPGVATTVTWSVSDPSKVQIVSSTGTSITVRPINGTVTGQVGIQATATADAGKSGGAVLNILPPLTPATVSINSINVGGTLLPVNPLNVAGQIDVVANVDPGDFIVTKIELLIDGRVVAQQTLAPSANADVSQIVMSYNTARYAIPGNPDPSLTTTCLAGNPAPPTGHACVDFQNGQRVASLRITTGSGSTAGTATSIETNLTFNNASGYHVMTTRPSRSATGTNGQLWYGGGADVMNPPADGGNTTVTAWPVNYAGRTMTSLTMCMPDAVAGGTFFGIGSGFPFGTHVCATDAAAPFSVQLFSVQSNVALPARGFGFVSAALSSAPTGDGLPVAAVAVNAANGQALLNAQTPVNIDNNPVQGATYFMNMTAPAQDAWANAAYSFSTTANYFGATDIGVGLGGNGNLTGAGGRMAGGFTTFQYAPTCGPTAGVWVNHTNQTTNVTANDITPSTCDFTNGAFNGRVHERDRLGNQGTFMLATSNPPINDFESFGVDKTNPMIRESAGLPHGNNTAVTALGAAPHFRVEYQDDRAGFGATPQSHHLVTASHATAAIIPSTNLPSDGLCLVSGGGDHPGTSFYTAPACTFTLVAPVAVLLDGFRQGPGIDLAAAPANGLAGYYRYTTFVTDKAGNSSTTLSRGFALDIAAPVTTGVTVPFLLTAAAGNSAANAFVSTFSDDVEVNDGTFRLVYPEVPVGGGNTLAYPRTNVNTRYDNTISSPGQMSHVTPFGAPFVRSIRTVGADSAVQAASGAEKPTTANIRVWDVFGTVSNIQAPAIPPGNVENGVDFLTFNAANALQAITQFYVRPELGTVGFIPAGLKAEVKAPFNAINAPFVRVDFYRLSGGEYQYLGSSTTATNTDNGVNRFWTYTIPTAGTVNTPTTLTLQGTIVAGNNIIAVGVTAAGDGLVTLPRVL